MGIDVFGDDKVGNLFKVADSLVSYPNYGS